ncbi:hypothetical protein SAMN05518671_2264 [Stenotrophomonas lactitubi]|nr:hypothetical protein SAMN04487863_3647 [Stenotrophomonas sp. yr243]SNT48007.1 hypothetical protein SAMN05518671_2264 [Stenotrophomonas lactitubi]
MAPSMAPTVLQAHTAPPSTVSRRRLVDPRHAWMNLHRNRIFRQFIEEHPRMAWIYRVDQGRHPPRAGHAFPTVCGDLSKAGWVRLRGCPRHGCRGQAYRDVLAASPATGPTPPSHRNPAFAVAVALASAGAGRSPAGKPNLNSLFCVRSHPSARLCGSAAAVRFPPGSPATGVRPIARPHSDAVRHAFQPALRVGCTQFSQRGSRERSESADQFDLPPSVRSDRR